MAIASADDDTRTTAATRGTVRGIDERASAHASVRTARGGGSIGIATARAPRNVRAHAATVADLLLHSHHDPTLATRPALPGRSPRGEVGVPARAGQVASAVKREAQPAPQPPPAPAIRHRALDEHAVRELLLAVDAAVDDSRQQAPRAVLPGFLPHAAGDFEFLALPRELFILPQLSHDAGDDGVIEFADHVTILPVQPRGNPSDGPGSDAEAESMIPAAVRQRLRIRLSGIIMLGVVVPSLLGLVMFLVQNG